jgi:uncharacterized cupredoxin-like copper-binding protein
MVKPWAQRILPLAAVAVTLQFMTSAPMADSKTGAGAEIGRPAEATAATRTVEVVMYDNYYEPEEISVQEGEIVRFVIRNAGEFVHEFNIGTAEQHTAHQSEMQMMVEHGVLEPDRVNREAAKAMQASMGHGMHEEPNSVLVEPGRTAEIVWAFPQHAELEFACNVPGHYDSGMQGVIKLEH